MSSVVSKRHLCRPLTPVSQTPARLLFCSELMTVGGWGDIRVASHGEPPSPNQMARSSPLGVSFPHPSKRNSVLSACQMLCSLAKPALVTGICQYVNGFTVFQQLQRPEHMPHTWQKEGLGVGHPAGNWDPQDRTQALRLERGCWEKTSKYWVRLLAPLPPPPWQSDEDTRERQGDSPRKHVPSEVWLLSARKGAHLSNSA